MVYINRLMNIGFTEYEAKTYNVLLQKSGLGATELSQLAGVPRTKIYEVLNNLNQKGFCIQIEGKKKTFKAVSPEFAFQGLVESYEADMARKRSDIEHLAEDLRPIYEKEVDDELKLDYIEIIRERTHVLQKVKQIGKLTTGEVLTMNKAPYAINFNKTIEHGSVGAIEGQNYKFISERKDMENENFLTFMEIWQDAGAEIRIVDEVPVKLIIFDKKTIVLSLPEKIPTQPKYTSLIIEHEDMAKVYLKIFGLYFNEGISLDDYKKEIGRN